MIRVRTYILRSWCVDRARTHPLAPLGGRRATVVAKYIYYQTILMQLIKHILSVDITHISRARVSLRSLRVFRFSLLLASASTPSSSSSSTSSSWPSSPSSPPSLRGFSHCPYTHPDTYYIISLEAAYSHSYICLSAYSVSLLSISLWAIGCVKRIRDFNLNGFRRVKMIHSDTKQYMLSRAMKLRKTTKIEKRKYKTNRHSKFDELKFRFNKDVIARCDFD